MGIRLSVAGRNRRLGSRLVRHCPRWAAVCMLLLACLHPSLAEVNAATIPTLAEVGMIDAVRRSTHESRHQAAADAAEAYLQAFPQGKYSGEAILALAEALEAIGHSDAALVAYDRLAESPGESPFREYALAGSIRLLRKKGSVDKAQQRLNELLDAYPRSLTRPKAQLWQGELSAEAGDPQGVINSLAGLPRGELKTGGDQATYDRIMAMAHVEIGRRQEAQPFLARYLAADDSPQHKAPVLMFLAAEARQGKQWAAARDYYSEVTDRYPYPPELGEALYWRAELHARTVLAEATADDKERVRSASVAYFSAYLDAGEERYRERALHRRAALLAEAGRYEEALADYDRLIGYDPDLRNDPAIISARAAILKNLQRVDEAVVLLGEAARNESITQTDRKGLLVEEVRVHYDRQECSEVLRLLQPLPVFENAGQRNQAMFMRGFCLYREGRWDKATWDLEYLVNDPQYQDLVWAPLIDAYERSGYHSRLVHLIEERLQRGGVASSPDIYRLLARSYENLDQPAQVLAIYSKLEALDPNALDDPDARIRLGKAEEALGRPGRAKSHYEAALGYQLRGEPAAPYYRQTLDRLHSIYQRAGEWEALVALNREAGEILTDPSDREALAAANIEAYIGWGKSEMDWGRFAVAAQHYESARELVPPDRNQVRLEVLALLGEAYRQGGRQEQGTARYELELQTARDPLYRLRISIALADYYRDWGDALVGEAQSEESARLYEKALQYLPEQQWEARYRILLKLDPIYRQRGETSKLIAYLEAIEPTVTDSDFRVNLKKYRTRLYRDRALESAKQGDMDAAMADFDRAAALLEPGDWQGRYELIVAKEGVLGLAQRYEAQLALLREAIELAPDPIERDKLRLRSIAARIGWGEHLLSQSDTEGALAQYGAAREALQIGDWEPRRDIVLAMTEVHKVKGEFQPRLDLLEEVLPLAPAGEERAMIRAAMVGVYHEWGQSLQERQESTEAGLALEKYRMALDLLDRSEWRRRYQVAQAMGRIYLERADYRQLTELYKSIHPDIMDQKLARELAIFIGQAYLEWADKTLAACSASCKSEHARRRYHQALDILPPEDWELRLGTIKKLAPIYEAENDYGALAALYAGLVPLLPDEEMRREFSVFLGRIYWDKLQDQEQARLWIAPVDNGGNDPLSLESGYILAEIAVRNGEADLALELLKALVARDLTASTWLVPIHDYLAVLYLQQNEMKRALTQYRIISGIRDKAIRRAYPRSIAHAAQKIKEIEGYLRVTGGAAGADITVPGGIAKPPIPPPKDL